MPRSPRRLLPVLALLLAALPAWAGADCRIAFDIGSSGIRAGATGSARVERAQIDFLAPQWAGQGLAPVLDDIAAALKALPAEGGFPQDCARVGGGFSAWRLALQDDPTALVAALRRLRADSGVAVLVMPQRQEGAYGYFAARRALGPQLKTSHILDIGGGSLQIAGVRSSFGAALGQKVWHRRLCRLLRPDSGGSCTLQPLSPDELVRARTAARAALAGVRPALGGPVSLTAISRSVSHGILPALQRLPGGDPAVSHLARQAITSALDGLAPLAPDAAQTLTGIAPPYRDTLISDLILVEALLAAAGSDGIEVAAAELDNLPGLLADDRAYAWERHYSCYLARLAARGIRAYRSDPESCPLAGD